MSITVTDDWNFTPFIKSPLPSHGHISTSITNYLHPPIVKKSKYNTEIYDLICGQDRYISFQKLAPESSHITALVLPSDIFDDIIFHYLLSDKLVSGKFSIMEKAHFLSLCCKHMPSKSVTKIFLPLLEEKPQPYILKKLTALTSLEPEIQESIHTGFTPSKLGYDLLALSSNDRIKLHHLFKQLEFGGGKQKRLLSLCKDLAFRIQIDISTLLIDDKYLTILNHSEMNVPQKGATLLTLLQKQLSPASTDAENNFRKRVRRMELPGNCTVKHSPAFEKDGISVSMEFKNMDHLERQIDTINTLFY